MIDPRNHEGAAALLDDLGIDDAEVDEILDLFEALLRWRRTSERESQANQRAMRVGANDMRALRFLMAARTGDDVVTPSMLAAHLGLQGSSVTKLLDRLERAGHVRREPHPTDRRSLAVVVTERSATAASASVGAAHLGRFRLAASMRSAERRAATRFLTAMAELSGPDPAAPGQGGEAAGHPEPAGHPARAQKGVGPSGAKPASTRSRVSSSAAESAGGAAPAEPAGDD